jgi:hypothetical protein
VGPVSFSEPILWTILRLKFRYSCFSPLKWVYIFIGLKSDENLTFQGSLSSDQVQSDSKISQKHQILFKLMLKDRLDRWVLIEKSEVMAIPDFFQEFLRTLNQEISKLPNSEF